MQSLDPAISYVLIWAWMKLRGAYPKCRYELRVNLFQIEYAALKERLASVYGFEVSVYEDRDGEVISSVSISTTLSLTPARPNTTLRCHRIRGDTTTNSGRRDP
jgi:hypothetical protein